MNSKNESVEMERVLDFLKYPIWPVDIESDVEYIRQHDDTDGGSEGNLRVMFSVDGDAWIAINNHKLIRFRNSFGGGKSLNTYAALLILAKAIQLDNNNPVNNFFE